MPSCQPPLARESNHSASSTLNRMRALYRYKLLSASESTNKCQGTYQFCMIACIIFPSTDPVPCLVLQSIPCKVEIFRYATVWANHSTSSYRFSSSLSSPHKTCKYHQKQSPCYIALHSNSAMAKNSTCTQGSSDMFSLAEHAKNKQALKSIYFLSPLVISPPPHRPKRSRPTNDLPRNSRSANKRF